MSGRVPHRALSAAPPRRPHKAVARLSAAERDEHLRLAAAWGCSLSEAVRRAIRESLRGEAARRALRSGLSGEGADSGLFG